MDTKQLDGLVSAMVGGHFDSRPDILLAAIGAGKVDVNHKFNGSPLLTFALSGMLGPDPAKSFEVAQALVARGADVNAYSKNSGWAPIHYAKTPEAVALLASQPGFVADAPSKGQIWSDTLMKGETALQSATLQGNLPLAEALLKAGASQEVPFGAEYKYPETIEPSERVDRGAANLATRLKVLRGLSPDLAAARPVSIAQSDDETTVALNSISRAKPRERDREDQAPEDFIRPVAVAAAVETDSIRQAAGRKVEQEATPEKKPDQPIGADWQDVSNAPATLLNGRFVRDDKGEYRRVGEERVALADEGERIRFVSKEMDAFQAAVELAKSKGWEGIEVAGTDVFKAEAWFHAKSAGLEVVGYEPTEADLARLPATPDQARQEVPAQGAEVSVLESRQAAQRHALDAGFSVRPTSAEDGRYAGPIIHETPHHVVQDLGRNVSVLHEKSKVQGLDLGGSSGAAKSVRIQYQGGKGQVQTAERGAALAR